MQEVQKNESQAFYEDVVREVVEDFSRRQMERAQIEKQWELNLNYLSGNQYCEIASNGDLEETEKYYFWQSRESRPKYRCYWFRKWL